MTLFHNILPKIAGVGLFIVGLVIASVVHPFVLGFPTGDLVCALGAFLYVSAMENEKANQLKSKGLGGFSLLGITLLIILMCAFTLGVFYLREGSIPAIVIPFLVVLLTVYVVLMYWVYFTNR